MRLMGSAWLFLVLATGACGGGSSLSAPEGQQEPPPPQDTTTPPPPPIDTTLPPPADTTTPPVPPPDTTTPPLPPVHSGMPFGPFVTTQGNSGLSVVPPADLTPGFNSLVTAAYAPTVMAKLDAARRSNGRVLLNFSGSSERLRDDQSGGFDLVKWKKQVDKFRAFDLSSYIADGTLIGHFLMDEPDDPNNWNGQRVALADIEAMAAYSKEIWPDLPTIVRGWPSYLQGGHYEHLDAAWAQYHSRFGPIDEFVRENVRGAEALGLDLVMGLNVVAGSGADGLPGYYPGKWSAMTAAQVKTWGSALLAEPHACAFFVYRYPSGYFNLPEIQAALAELGGKAASLPKRRCQRS